MTQILSVKTKPPHPHHPPSSALTAAKTDLSGEEHAARLSKACCDVLLKLARPGGSDYNIKDLNVAMKNENI